MANRTITRTVTTTVTETLNDRAELKLLQELVAPLMVVHENYKRRGDILKATRQYRKIAVGQVLIVAGDGMPDSDGEYSVYFLNDAGESQTSYIKANYARPWNPDATPRKRKSKQDAAPRIRRRQLDLGK